MRIVAQWDLSLRQTAAGSAHGRVPAGAPAICALTLDVRKVGCACLVRIKDPEGLTAKRPSLSPEGLGSIGKTPSAVGAALRRDAERSNSTSNGRPFLAERPPISD